MKPISNTPMLITYADSLGGDLPALQDVLAGPFAGAFGGVHILPFYPSSGDRGFAVIDYDIVDPAFGTWEDIERIAAEYYVMADFMINHVSIRSAEFVDYMRNGDASAYRDMFVHWDEFWPNGEPTQDELGALYRRKSVGPVKDFTRDDGTVVRLWNTFFEEQVDIDPWQPATQEYFQRNLGRLADIVPLIRFDAFAYASKRAGTSCFFVEPEVWEVLDIGMKPLLERGAQMLPEIHENYRIQLAMAERGHWVYDFALPMLMLHTIFSENVDRLRHWLAICPRKQFTTLDTHDGIGVVDVVGLLSDDEIDAVTDRVNTVIDPLRQYHNVPPGLITRGREQTRLYQLMTSFFSALGEDEDAMLLARAVQLWVPGIPQVYYVGALFGANDVEALRESREARAVNRHDYSSAEIANDVRRPAVAAFLDLLRLRTSCRAFDGAFAMQEDTASHVLDVSWSTEDVSARLVADFSSRSFEVTTVEQGEQRVILAWGAAQRR
ncbi:sucrose phosphorylase [Microbacterium sp. NPDC091313]